MKRTVEKDSPKTTVVDYTQTSFMDFTLLPSVIGCQRSLPWQRPALFCLYANTTLPYNSSQDRVDVAGGVAEVDARALSPTSALTASA